MSLKFFFGCFSLFCTGALGETSVSVVLLVGFFDKPAGICNLGESWRKKWSQTTRRGTKSAVISGGFFHNSTYRGEKKTRETHIFCVVIYRGPRTSFITMGVGWDTLYQILNIGCG